MDFLSFIYVYTLGGITFLPIIFLLVFYSRPKYEEEVQYKEDELQLREGEIEEKDSTGIKAFKTGWITVTQEYIESVDRITASTRPLSESAESKSAYSSLYKLAKNSDLDENKESHIVKTQTDPKAETQVRKSQKKHRYFAVLKHGNLFLYKNEKLNDVKHVIVLSNSIVSTWPRNLTEGQIFSKYASICIMKRDWKRPRRLSDDFEEDTISTFDVLSKGLSPPPGSIFIYCDLNIDKEDWYFALIKATKTEKNSDSNVSPNLYAKTLHLETQNLLSLIQNIYSSEGQLYTKWLNGFAGRLFLSLQKTDFLNELLKNRLEKKLEKIKKPGFLDEFKLVKLDPGVSAPLITWPSLKEINPNGELVIKFYLQYTGRLSFQISTKVNINLGSHFKPREVDVLLSITIDRLEGPMLTKFKPPPSNRVWYAFEYDPIISLSIEPIISSRQITYNIVTSSIEKKFKEAIRDSLVLPHWDDFVFYSSEEELYRGGIWDKRSRGSDEPQDIQAESKSDSDEVQGEELKGASNNNENNTDRNFQKLAKSKLSSTISDLSKRVKKQKSSSTLGFVDDNFLSDGSFADSSNKKDDVSDLNKGRNTTLNTLKKIGKWYFKDENQPAKEKYTPPEMISNRRARKSVSDAGMTFNTFNQSSYEMFNKSNSSSFYRAGSKTQDIPEISRNGSDRRISSHSYDRASLTNSESRNSDIDYKDENLHEGFERKLDQHEDVESEIKEQNDWEKSPESKFASYSKFTNDSEVELEIEPVNRYPSKKLHRKPPPPVSTSSSTASTGFDEIAENNEDFYNEKVDLDTNSIHD